MSSLTAALGLAADARIVIPHVDDVACCHGANVAMAQLPADGPVTSGSVMVPTDWFAEAAELAVANPATDLGVHLTLTSESAASRWRPLSTESIASGLLDDDGFLWPDVDSVRRAASPDAVEGEVRAQLDTALAAGIDITHIDHHMGATLSPEFAAATMAVANEYGLPVMFPRDLDGFFAVMDQRPSDIAEVEAVGRELERNGRLFVDHFVMGLTFQTDDCDIVNRRFITEAPAGVTFVSLHAAAPGDVTAVHPDDAAWRTAEYDLYRSAAFSGWVGDQDVTLVGFRELRDVMRD